MFFLLLPFFDTIFLAVGAWLIELENCLAKAPRAMGARENGVTNVPAQSMETKDRGLLTALFYAKTTHSADAAPGADGDGNGWWAKQTFINFKQLKSSQRANGQHLNSAQLTAKINEPANDPEKRWINFAAEKL